MWHGGPSCALLAYNVHAVDLYHKKCAFLCTLLTGHRTHVYIFPLKRMNSVRKIIFLAQNAVTHSNVYSVHRKVRKSLLAV
jgi:hypothetical protein